MRKIVVSAIVVVMLVVVLVAAPWGIGQLAEQRVNSGLDQLVETAPYLSIVERKFTRGWFASEQEVTFEVFGPWLRAMNPKTVLDTMAKPQAEASSAEPPAATPPDESAAAGSPDAVASEAAPEEAAPDEAAPAAVVNPMKFTVRNHILHGPVLWFTGLGIARVDSTLVIPETIRAELTKVFGEKPPLQVSTRVRFFGGGTTTFSGDARDLTLEGKDHSVSYDAFKFKVGYSAHLDDIDVAGAWPRVEVKDGTKGETFLLKGLKVSGDSHRVRGDLYDGDFKFLIDQTHFVGSDHEATDIADLHYIVDTTIDDDFMDVALKFGSGAVKSKALEQLGLSLKEVHYDFTVRRLHLETLEKMMEAIKASYAKPLATPADVDSAMMQPMKEFGLELLKHDPEFVIDRFGGSTPDGDAYLKGIITLKGVTAQDVAAGAMGLVGKLDADLNFEMAQKLAEKLPNGATAVGGAIDQGYAKREGDRIVSRFEFKNGKLKINGKEQGIPGLGPPQVGPESGSAPQPE
jgi:uncharacterized protein YdgA (DUF945 family)